MQACDDALGMVRLRSSARCAGQPMLDAHMQFYEQVADYGRAQLRAADGRRPKD
jgi:hypothetical protein